MKLNTMSANRRADETLSSSAVALLSAEESTGALEESPRNSIETDIEEVISTRTGENRNKTTASPKEPFEKWPLAKQQGVVLLEDAIYYRSIHHKLDSFSIRLHRWYHSVPVKWSHYSVIFVLMFLAFLETPSSLVWSADPRQNGTRYEFPPRLLEGVEFASLLMLFILTSIQSYLTADLHKAMDFPKKHSWLTGNFIVIVLSFTDIIVSLALGNEVYRWRFRRLLRPYFLASCSTMLKKTLKCIVSTLPEIASVLTLLLLHVYFFMMLGMLCFPKGGRPKGNESDSELNNTEWRLYFGDLDTAFISLLVLLTTANNPDVMMPAYSQNRLYAIYFIAFSLIGTFLIFNLLTAVVYNQFRGYFQNSMQASHFRRCVAFSAAFTVLVDRDRGDGSVATSSSDGQEPSAINHDGARLVSMPTMKKVLCQVSMQPEQRTVVHHNMLNLGLATDTLTKLDFEQVFANIDNSLSSEILQPTTVEFSEHAYRSKVQRIVLHPVFNIFANVMVLVNAILITVEIAIHYETAFKKVFSDLNIINYVFAGYYFLEQTLKVIALGKRYFLSISDVYDGMITLALIIVETVQLARYAHMDYGPDVGTDGISLWDCARIINILVILRLLRIIPNFKPMAVVTTTLLDIMRNLASFAGVLAIIYYVFAIIGMMLFEGATDPSFLPPANASNNSIVVLGNSTCGTFEQLEYWANNFNDFASSLVVLWDIMVVNNWGVFLDVYTRKVGTWSQLYFIVWWIVSVVISVNLFIALILDHFIAKWDRAHEAANRQQRLRRRETVQSLFVASMHDPSPLEVDEELSKHPFLRWHLQES